MAWPVEKVIVFYGLPGRPHRMKGLNHKIPVIFHNLKNYDSHCIMQQELRKFNPKINIIPNGLEKYMGFTINNKLCFIDSCFNL